MPIGCVQGSILGPRLFTLYLSGLQNSIKHNLVSYADDSYVIVKADDLENLKLEVKTTTKAHSKFLKEGCHGTTIQHHVLRRTCLVEWYPHIRSLEEAR